jgi:hypothetical protein
MAGLKETDVSPTGDALLLTALFLPFAPIVATFYLYVITSALGCPVDTAQACEMAGLDFNHLYARSADMLAWTAKAGRAGALLLVYLLLLTGLVQFTIVGFRGRVVRTCAVIMWAGVLPLMLALASAITRAPQHLCASGPCDAGNPFLSFALYGHVFFQWLTDIAVPLAVLVSGLLALTLGYRMLIGRFVSLVTQRD